MEGIQLPRRGPNEDSYTFTSPGETLPSTRVHTVRDCTRDTNTVAWRWRGKNNAGLPGRTLCTRQFPTGEPLGIPYINEYSVVWGTIEEAGKNRRRVDPLPPL